MHINGREITPNKPPYVIAEISCNHNGSLDTALALINVAKEAGADAVKFQAYEPGTITIDCDMPDFIVKDGPWKGRKLYELYSKAYTPFDWFPYLFGRAQNLGITAFASVFDKSSVDMLEKLDCPAYKIASMEITDTPLIEYAASTGKPIIISTGMATDQEIIDSNWAIMRGRAPGTGTDRAVLHCVSGYPTNPSDFNLRRMDQHCRIFGISDHTQGYTIPVAATALGAMIIEKHLMRGDETTEDYEFSLTPIQFRRMVNEVYKTWRALQPSKSEAEESSRQMRRSLYVVKDIRAGEFFTEENVRSIRPAYGLAPGKLEWVLTKTAKTSLVRGTALKESHIATS